MNEYGDQSASQTTTTVSGHSDRMLTAMFHDRDSAERAYDTLRSRGYSDKDVNLMMSDETRDKHFASQHEDGADTDLGNKATEKAGIGSAIGGTLGAVAAAIAAIGTSLVLPGVGLVIAGPLAAAFAGAGAGGLTGGIIGALIGSGIPKDQAEEYETGIKRGGIVIGVHPRNEEDARYLQQQSFR